MCREGYYGNPVQGIQCKPCECDKDLSDYCSNVTGECFCKLKGTKNNCIECEDKYRSIYGSCFYEMNVNYVVTFNMTQDEYRYTSQMNLFLNTTLDSDLEINITCDPPTNISMILWKGNKNHSIISKRTLGSFARKFSREELKPLQPHQQVNLLLFVSDFRAPFYLKVSYYYIDQLDLYKFFITFFSCFFTLLLIAFVLWKFRQRIDIMRRTQRQMQEMEEMAKRPCSRCLLVVDDQPSHHPLMDSLMIINALDKSEAKLVNNKLKKSKIVAVALEPLNNCKTAVMSIIIRLPHVDEACTLPSQSGLVIGSTLVTMGNHARKSNEKQPKKKSVYDVNVEPHLV